MNDLREVAERIVRDATPATASGATCFVARYQIKQLEEALSVQPPVTGIREQLEFMTSRLVVAGEDQPVRSAVISQLRELASQLSNFPQPEAQNTSSLQAFVPAITPQEIAEWRQERDNGMTSAVGEYTPAEFWKLLDEVERMYRCMGVPAALLGDGRHG